MLREASVYTDWCDKTMSMLREKQFEACERRLNKHLGLNLFSQEVTEREAQGIWGASYYHREEPQRLLTLQAMRDEVLRQLPLEACYLSQGEAVLIERLLINHGSTALGEWDDIAAAEALVSRLWCSFHPAEEEWFLELPEVLHEPLLCVLNSPEYTETRSALFRYEGLLQGLLYIVGFLHSQQPVDLFLQDVIKRKDGLANRLARRYLKASFEYVWDSENDLILLHPGLADPYRMMAIMMTDELFSMDLSHEMIAGGMNGIFPEEIPLHDAMCGVLQGSLRPEYEAVDAAEDLRILAKQNVDLTEMEAVMASMLCVLPTEDMKRRLKDLKQRTPHWLGLKTCLQH